MVPQPLSPLRFNIKLEAKEPSQSESACPVVLIQMPEGSPRVCIDYRQLNERTVRDSYPIPRMDDCLDSLGDAQFFSTVECNAGYWQMPLAELDKPKTAFTCHCGTYQCRRLPFGLCHAPATFQRVFDMILSGVKWQNVLVYFDDLIIFSADAESHLSHLDTMLTLLGKQRVTLKAQKCHLFTHEVEYLGHVVRPGRLSVNEKSLKAIKKASFPQTQTQQRSFLGMCNVNRRFTVDFAKTAKPLNNLNSVLLPKRLSPPTPEKQNACICPRRLTPVAIERLTAGPDPGEIVPPGRSKENFLQPRDSLIPLIWDTMEKTQARYKRAFDERVKTRREALQIGE